MSTVFKVLRPRLSEALSVSGKTKRSARLLFVSDVLMSDDVVYASEIAPTGQPSSHAPQSMHSSALTTYLPSPSEIADTGQVSAHAPQEMQSSLITLAMVFAPFNVFVFRP